MKALLVIMSLTFLASCTQNPQKIQVIQNDKMIKQDTMKMDDTMTSGSNMSPDAMKMDTMKKDTMIQPTGYREYDAATMKSALAAWQKVALFFHASWCPTCKALEKNINANLSSIPADTLILKVDYDQSDDLRQKYKVTTQHTTVLIDRDMNLISKKLWARNIAEIFN